ncbi:SPOR domain-containing protein, partial [Bacteroidota bacterium]
FFEEEDKIWIGTDGGGLVFNKGKYTFEQYYKANFLLDSFGMTEISLESKENVTPELKKAEKKKEHKTSGRIYDRERTRRRILIYTPIAAALIFLFVYIDMVSFNDELIYPSEYRSLQQDYKQNKAAKETVKLVEKIDPAIDKREALLYTEKQVNKYFIVAGSFKSLINAKEFANNLEKQGFTTQIIDGNLYRVSIGGFATKSEAQQELNELKSTATPSLWVLKK